MTIDPKKLDTIHARVAQRFVDLFDAQTNPIGPIPPRPEGVSEQDWLEVFSIVCPECNEEISGEKHTCRK